ncbi:unnamed protein product [Effrenium voratum]|uniref:Uncharacterized protein n=1 Tax=Effrenium voratum TaxID=2562239 RepID=A0AA36J344_9DINO|nr:unnamed protein product [Effrenium voratum]CAJ1428635.1 unnamed protein product [Effrenium voratum]
MALEADNMTLSAAIEATEHLTLRDLAAHVHHFVDVIYDVPPGSVNINNLKAIIRDKAWEELPEVLKMKERPKVDYVSQYFLIPQVNGNICVLKHFYIKQDKVKGSYVARLIRGEGWDFIITHGERDKGNLKQLRWIHRQINRDGSPIHGWNEKLVQRALDSLANDGTMAALITRYDLTIDCLEPDVLEIFEQLVPDLRGHALWLLGEPGIGKTPLARILAMMFSRYHGGTGTFRTACDLDFFRGVSFDKTCPGLFDDGEVGPIKKKKAFSDVGDQETILRERWTAAKFVQHQLRIVIDNQYDPENQPPEVFFNNKVDHKVFMKLVRPAPGYIPAADAHAILKRAVFVVFGKEWIYYRPPTEKEVERLKWPRGDMFKDSCKPVISNMKDGGPPPGDCEEMVAWENAWLKEAFRKHDAPAQAPVEPAPRHSLPHRCLTHFSQLMVPMEAPHPCPCPSSLCPSSKSPP